MAKVIQSQQQQVVAEPWWVKIRIVYIGLALGVVWWVLTAILRHYVVEPFACRDLSGASACVNSFGISGNIAAVLVAVLGIWLLIRYFQPRPIIIAVATAILLWDLGAFLNGLVWWAALLWAIFFYAASYTLFSMVSRVKLLAVALVLAAIIVIGIRIILAL